jgi:hypothetical protein
MLPHRRTPDAQRGVSPQLRKGVLMINETLKRKLRGFPTSGLGVRVVSS